MARRPGGRAASSYWTCAGHLQSLCSAFGRHHWLQAQLSSAEGSTAARRRAAGLGRDLLSAGYRHRRQAPSDLAMTSAHGPPHGHNATGHRSCVRRGCHCGRANASYRMGRHGTLSRQAYKPVPQLSVQEGTWEPSSSAPWPALAAPQVQHDADRAGQRAACSAGGHARSDGAQAEPCLRAGLQTCLQGTWATFWTSRGSSCA